MSWWFLKNQLVWPVSSWKSRKKKTRVFPEWHRQNVLNKKTKKPHGILATPYTITGLSLKDLWWITKPSHTPRILHLGLATKLKLENSIWVFPKNRGFPPNHPLFVGFSIIFTIHLWGFSPYFWKTRYIFVSPFAASRKAFPLATNR